MTRWTAAFRWLDDGLSLQTSFFRWPRFFASCLTPPSWTWNSSRSRSSTLGHTLSTLEPRRWAARLRLPDIDDVVWSVVSAVESVALVSFLCFFFVFCGCTI